VGLTFIHLFENSLLVLPRSCDGEPAPDRVFPAILLAEFNAPGSPKGDLKALPLGGSVPVGEVFAVEEPERGRGMACCGRYPKVRCSDLADDIIDYPVHQKSLESCPRDGSMVVGMYRYVSPYSDVD
jgi:hypothetical protein